MGASTGKRRGRAFNKALSPPVILGCLPSSWSAVPASILRLAGVCDVSHAGSSFLLTRFPGGWVEPSIGRNHQTHARARLRAALLTGISGFQSHLLAQEVPSVPSVHISPAPRVPAGEGGLWKIQRARLESATLACSSPLSGVLSLSLSVQPAHAPPSMLLPSPYCRSSSCISHH